MKVLVTGAAGFIGFHVIGKLLQNGHEVVGLDNINDYYEVALKFDRLKELGVQKDLVQNTNELSQSTIHQDFRFIRMSLEDRKELPRLFQSEAFDMVCNLAAQAGVRYSLENPDAYIDSNIVGFLNILECCRHNKIQHLVYASSSSVYGLNSKIPFETLDRTDSPISIYAATKKSNELMAHAYSHLYSLPTTGLRFFTVYGPWGRPDMAPILFAKAITGNQPINVFNEGDMARDFTYVDDIVEGVVRIIEKKITSKTYNIYNIGNSSAVKLLDFIEILEKHLGKKAVKNMLPMQPGDVKKTWANVDDLMQDYDYRPKVSVDDGVKFFVEWFLGYYNRAEKFTS